MSDAIRKLGDQFIELGKRQYGVALDDERQREQWAKSGMLSSFITGEVLGPLSEQAITPQEALKMVVEKGNAVGVPPERALGLFQVTSQIANQQAQKGGYASLKEALELEKMKEDVLGKKQTRYGKTAEGIQETQTAKEGVPALRGKLNDFKTKLKDAIGEGDFNLEKVSDILGSEYGLESGIFQINTAETVEDAAQRITTAIMSTDERLGQYFDAGQIQQEILRILNNPNVETKFTGQSPVQQESAFGVLSGRG